MATGLSTRMATSLQTILPGLSAVMQENDPTKDIIDLSSAENQLIRHYLQDTIETAIKTKLTNNAFDLPAFGGDRQTRAALATFFNDHFNPVSVVTTEEVVLTGGAGSCIEALVQSLCDEGDSVIIPAPYWFGFKPYFAVRAKVEVLAANTPTYSDHATDLVSALRSTYSAAKSPERIKAVILCNPNNPLSQCYPESALRDCMKFCQEHDLHLISDELYALAKIHSAESKFVSALSIPLSSETSATAPLIHASKVHVVWSASKLFGLSGLRIGCLVSQANPLIRTAVSLLTFTNVSSLSSISLSTLLSSDELPSLIDTISNGLSESYKRFEALFRKLGLQYVTAEEGLFIFAKLGKNLASADEEAAFFTKLKDAGVMVSPGRFYGDREFGWARIMIAVPIDVVTKALDKIERFYSEMK
ncbi:PLP-dependent transferase [Lojkania enalia]|uniref:PLP-dependent transferase n=1 Tax=Lojkania enalia TaxID=147567 RepID=A0A9P4N518_9PLEO|nr:PLP-dependent transferase [Didymosphaeria enalia]